MQGRIRFGSGFWRLFFGLFSCAVLAVPAAARDLVHCADGLPMGFDPARHTDPASTAVTVEVYDRLVALEPGTTVLAPGLAEGWEVSEDGLEYVFTLRSDVTFHATASFTPTRPVSADDVVFSIERQRLQGHPYHRVPPGGWPMFEALGLGGLIDSVEKVDELRVKFVLNEPASEFPAYLAMDFAAILSAEYAEAMIDAGTPGELDRVPIGTGPFLVEPGEEGAVRLARHNGHWGGAVDIEGIAYVSPAGDAARADGLEGGTCDVAVDLPAERLAGFEESDGFVLEALPGFDLGYLAFNTEERPFDTPGVRRALSLAIDRERLVSEVFGARGMVATSVLPPAMWGTRDLPDGEVHNPEAARAALAAEGASGARLTLWTMPVRRAYNPDAQAVATRIVEDLAAVGIDVRLEQRPWSDFLGATRDRDREGAVLFGWTGARPDPLGFYAPLLSCGSVGLWNRAQWCSEEFDQTLAAARIETDAAERAALFAAAEDIAAAEAPLLPLAHSVTVHGRTNAVEGLAFDAFGRPLFRNVVLAD